MIEFLALATPSEPLITVLFTRIDSLLEQFVLGIFQVINTTYGNAIFWAMNIYIIFYGIRLLMG